jgi:hypothetical protein
MNNTLSIHNYKIITDDYGDEVAVVENYCQLINKHIYQHGRFKWWKE